MAFIYLLLCMVALASRESKIQQVITLTQQHLWKHQLNSSYWHFPAYVGTYLISEYYLMSTWLGKNTGALDVEKLKRILLSTQLADGSWKQVEDVNKNEGDIDPTIFNYMFLKSEGFSASDPILKQAKNFILSKVGLFKASDLTKFKLASFGCFPYSKTSDIPTDVFNSEKSNFIRQFIAHWKYARLLPNACFKFYRVYKDMNIRLNELYTDQHDAFESVQYNEESFSLPPPDDIIDIINRILELQPPNGSFGSYTVSSLMCSMALQHFNSHYPTLFQSIDSKIEKAFAFVDSLYFNSGEFSYKGVHEDGRNWDTALIGWSLLESHDYSRSLYATKQYLLDRQTSSGGIPYGIDFEYAPDADQTSISLLFMCKLNHYSKEDKLYHSIDWLLSRQNNDGGFGAFYKDMKNDPSSVDLTGHILEALGNCGYNKENSIIAKAIEFVKKSQHENGGWTGIWGVNYIYAIGAVIPGLARVGVNVMTEEWAMKSLSWLATKQNSDGGWGESLLSYTDPAWIGRGKSTVSQTAWALLGLMEANGAFKDAINKGIDFLVTTYGAMDGWKDISCVGTGPRQYPVYSQMFPLIALSRYFYQK